jgi:hypothetical protein
MESFASMCLVDINVSNCWRSRNHGYLVVCFFEFFFYLANFIRLSKCLSFHGIIRMVSIGEREIFPLKNGT